MAGIFDRIKSFHIRDYVNMKAFLLVMFGFFMLTLIISSSIILVSLQNRHKAEETVREQSSFVKSLGSSLDLLRTGDFLFPEQESLKRTTPFLQREPRDEWTPDEVDRYWIDPEDTGIGEIGAHNRAMIEEMLDRIP